MAGAGQPPPEIWIGIDLGTTYSCVAVWQNNRVDIIPNDHSNRTTPSYVSFTKYDRLVGETAASQATANPLNTIYGSKRLIGRLFNDVNLQKESQVCPFEVVDGNESSNQSRPIILVDYLGKKKMFTPEAISAMILAKLKGIAEAYLGCPVNNAVISVPAMFNNSQRQATKDAGIIAGFKGIRLINEPTAVAMTYNLDMKINGQSGGKKNVLVFDLGGGTLDVSLVATENGNIEVKAVSGDTHLGGADFDNRIVSEFVKAFKKKHKKDISKNVKALARLRVASERAKKELSLLPQADVQIDSLFENIDFSASITRSQFEKLNNDLFHKCIEKVVQCLKHEEIIDTREVHDVVLVGGSSRIPKLTQMLQRFFNGKELCKSVHPDEAVAYGAALYAASLSSGGTTNNDIIIGSKTPLSLGFCHDNGNLQIVIPTNTTFPTRKTIFSRDNIDDQSRHGVRVWEEAETNSKTVNILGVLEFSVFPPAPTTSLKLEVCFEIDVDGILEVSAKQITTMNHCGQLTKADVNQLINEAEDYKARDEKREALLQAKSKLESYANGISEQLMTDPCNTANNIDAKKIKEYIDSEIEWLDSSADVSDITVFEKRLKELQRISEDLKELQSVRGDHGELQSDRGVRREQQSDRGVRREQQSDRGVRREQQSDRGDRREHQGDHREPRQPQSDRGDRREHQSDRVDPKQPQSDGGDCREHQSNRGDSRQQQSDRGDRKSNHSKRGSATSKSLERRLP